MSNLYKSRNACFLVIWNALMESHVLVYHTLYLAGSNEIVHDSQLVTFSYRATMYSTARVTKGSSTSSDC